MCFLMKKKHTTTYNIAKGANLNHMLPLDPAANLQEIQKKGWEWGGRLKRKRVDYKLYDWYSRNHNIVKQLSSN